MFKTLSSAAMLVFLLALLLAVLERVGVVRRQTALSLLKTVLICVGFALTYDGTARLIFSLMYETDGAPGIRELYGVKWLTPYFEGAETGSGLINLPGYALGKLLFGEYLMGGAVFSTLLTVTALQLTYLRLRSRFDERTARIGQAFVLTLPGVFLCFLPGWAAWALLGAALVFCFAGTKVKISVQPNGEGTAPAAEALFAVSAVLNALLLMMTVTRKLG